MLAFARRLLVLAALVLPTGILPGGASADEILAPADASAIQAVIQDQMAAFKIDDWAGAFSFASPVVQQKFQSPEVFSQMVTAGTPKVSDTIFATTAQSSWTSITDVVRWVKFIHTCR